MGSRSTGRPTGHSLTCAWSGHGAPLSGRWPGLHSVTGIKPSQSPARCPPTLPACVPSRLLLQAPEVPVKAANPSQCPPHPIPKRRLHQLGFQHLGQRQGACPDQKTRLVGPGSPQASLGQCSWDISCPRLSSPRAGGLARLAPMVPGGDRQELGLRIASLRNVSHRQATSH